MAELTVAFFFFLFSRSQTLNINKADNKINRLRNCCKRVCHFIPIDRPMMLLCLRSLLYKQRLVEVAYFYVDCMHSSTYIGGKPLCNLQFADDTDLRGRWGGGGERELVSWYFEPSQPQRITSELKQTSICLLFTLHTSHQAKIFQKPQN